MSYNFKDFFVGVIYVFVIFLPGGIALAALLYGIPNLAFALEASIKYAEVKWLMAIAGSYILGHFISYAGSELEDWYFKKWGAKRAEKEVSSELRLTAYSIVQSFVPALLVKENNVRRWAQTILRQSQSASYPAIEQKDADRRFFRNFLFAGLATSIVFFVQFICYGQSFLPTLVLVLIMLLSSLRYFHQDKMFTKMIFEGLVVAYSDRARGILAKHREFERRFLVPSVTGYSLESGTDIRQGYFSTDPERVVRVRMENNIGWLTIKGKSAGVSQPEYEYRIPEADAQIFFNMCGDRVIEKTRYEVKIKGFIWRIDEFKGKNAGLVIAEIEAGSEEELSRAVENKPKWLGKDITLKYEYRNSSLAMHPFSSWSRTKQKK